MHGRRGPRRITSRSEGLSTVHIQVYAFVWYQFSIFESGGPGWTVGERDRATEGGRKRCTKVKGQRPGVTGSKAPKEEGLC